MSRPKNCIPVSEAKTLQERWMDTRATDIEAVRGSKDASDFTFSLSDLEEFVKYVRDESTKQNVQDPGIRVYFAAYNDAKSTKATIFLAPTKKVGVDDLNNYNIDPLNRGNTGWPPNTY
ncbi:hypothetical protein [Rasiella sp. SM2506]|uniref:hypothetical protein n=1 Tax=Rasiella sp. SM2506 TaxID=3423914 RepID=UPI003D7A54E7